MENKKFDGLKLSNRTSMIAYSIMNIILVVCYLVEVLKKSRSMGYFAVFCIFALVPYVLCLAMYLKDKGTEYLKYAISGGYVIFYLFIIFTTVAYVYAFLIAVILISYNDIKVAACFMGTVSLGNIIQVAYSALSGQLDTSQLANVEIRVASVLLFTGYLLMATYVSKKCNDTQLELVEEEKEHNAALMSEILDVAEKITDDINTVSGKVDILETTANKTKDSMGEVAAGTNETVRSIQVQLEKTEQIQDTINSVEEASGMIVDNVNETKSELDLSKKNMDELLRCVKVSNDANANVSRELLQLREHTGKMQSIIDMINSIASQTSLLALNASIEAARAGDAGRGFAVVADEIRQLAEQSAKSAVDTRELIEGALKEIDDGNHAARSAAEALTSVIDGIQSIAETSRALSEASDTQSKAMDEANEGVNQIAEVVQSNSSAAQETSATSEELSAQADTLQQLVGKFVLKK